MRAEVIDVDGDQLVVRNQHTTALLDVISTHETRVGDVLSGTITETGIDTLKNETTASVLVAFVESSDSSALERTLF